MKHAGAGVGGALRSRSICEQRDAVPLSPKILFPSGVGSLPLASLQAVVFVDVLGWESISGLSKLC